MRRGIWRWAVMAVAFVAVATGLPADAVSPKPATSQLGCPDWGMYGRTLARTFATDCPTAINKTSVQTLLPAWFVKTERTVTASPAVAGGVVYVGDWSGTMYAIDAADGAVKWTYETAAAPGAAFGPIVSSAAVADVSFGKKTRRLIVFGAGPRLYAIDDRGKTVWVRYVGANIEGEPTEIESSPLIWNDTVYVGMDTHNQPDSATGGVRGGLLAVDVRTGKVRWKFNADNGYGCGGMWSSPVLDPKAKTVYMATANCRSDDPKAWTNHSEAVTALNALTGDVKWWFQPHEQNRKDHDFGATPNLFVDAQGRPVLGAGNKDGEYYALDPATGDQLWTKQVALRGDVQEDFSIGGFIGSPAIWEGNVFGGTAIGGPPYYHSLDGRDGSIRWRGAQAPSYSASAVANGLVFQGALDGVLRAYDANNGIPMWAAPLAGPISSAAAIVGDSLYIGSGTSSSDACAKDTPPFSEACMTAFDATLGTTGGIHGFRLLIAPDATGPNVQLFSGQSNQLDSYDLSRDPPVWSTWMANHSNGGRDLNAQICTISDKYILLGEDSDQSKGIPNGWGIFDIKSKLEVGKLIADYGDVEQAEQYGCVIEEKKGKPSRMFVSQVGSGDFGVRDGQLMVFFASSPAFDAVMGRRSADNVCPGGDCRGLRITDSHSCVIDPAIRTAGGMAVDAQGRLYVAEGSPTIPPEGAAPGRVLRYSPPFPTSAGDCFTKQPEVFIQDPLASTPGAIVAARDADGKPTGNWYVSSIVVPPVVNEYDANGAFVRNILPPGFATPFGLAVAPDGTLYIADLGVNVDPLRIPSAPDRFGLDVGEDEGSVLRVRFADGVPLPPEYLMEGLDFPDGLGIAPR